jgi:hypothetical protein
MRTALRRSKAENGMAILLVGDQRDRAYAVELTRPGPNEIREHATPKTTDPITIMRDPLRGGFAAVGRIVPITIQMRVLKKILRRGLRVKPTHSDGVPF